MYKLLLVVALLLCQLPLQGAIERRCAIDVGSGGTKVAVADVDDQTNSIVTVLYEHSFPVPYQAALDRSEDGTFDEPTRAAGLRVFREIKEITDKMQVQRITAVATSAFRKSNNSRAFVAEVERSTGIHVHIISQREEGEIAYYSAVAAGAYDPARIVVWDIGTGSLQMSTANYSGGLTIYMGEQMGSIAFKDYVIDVIQDRDLEDIHTPNPITEEQLKQADSYARAFGRHAYPLLKEKIKQEPTLIGIGRLFYHSIRPLASQDGVITRAALRRFITESLGKSDEELGSPFAHVDVTNCILVLAIMKSLHIQAIVPVDTTSTRGLLVMPAYFPS